MPLTFPAPQRDIETKRPGISRGGVAGERNGRNVKALIAYRLADSDSANYNFNGTVGSRLRGRTSAFGAESGGSSPPSPDASPA